MPDLELYGAAGCPYTGEMREWLEWKGSEFAEYDVETDGQARERLRSLLQPPFYRAGAGAGRQSDSGRMAGPILRRWEITGCRTLTPSRYAAWCRVSVSARSSIRLACANGFEGLGAQRGRGREDPPRRRKGTRPIFPRRVEKASAAGRCDLRYLHRTCGALRLHGIHDSGKHRQASAHCSNLA